MKKFLSIFIAALFFNPVVALAQSDSFTEILSLKSVSNDNVVSQITLLSNDIDPNSRSIDDKYKLIIDGKTVDLKEALARRLDWERRAFSYDHFTKGIQEVPPPQFTCSLGGPATGWILQVRYLTYDESNHQIKSSEMRDVYSEAGNCLYTKIIKPNDLEAEKAAAKAMIMLQTIASFYSDD